ncbi:MAG: hypothetical protein M3O21_03615 [Chloroflexota bacterium]|nr:hypothetical protein [Chloroflexota bacterium]
MARALVAVVVAVVGVVLWMVTRSTTHAPTVQAANWTFDSAEGNTLSIWVGTGACDDFDRTDTSEDANTVTVHAFTRAKPGLEDAPCILVLIPYKVTVQLATPLGDRTLLGCNDRRPADPHVNCRPSH